MRGKGVSTRFTTTLRILVREPDARSKGDCTPDKEVIISQWYNHIELCRKQWEKCYPVAMNECRKALGNPTIEPDESIESIVCEITRLKAKLKGMVEEW
jgi:hypothetical protein